VTDPRLLDAQETDCLTALGPGLHLLATTRLAALLQDTNRLAEAEPLSRRMLEIFLSFTRATGHEHPHLREAMHNYAGLLAAMGRSEAEVLAQLNAVAGPFGMRFGE